MAQKNRSKEVWLVPKRVSLHQTICLLDGIMERNYHDTTWNAGKQNNLGVNLKKWGATKDGKNISAQAIRTLAASIPQYLGFLYINTSSTPNTICITEVGRRLLEEHKDGLVKITNLVEGKDQLITESDIVLSQMEKLQITNPILLKDCENILVFPFRMTLKLLLELKYLDKEELAYIVFKIKDETEYSLALQQIRSFRKLDYTERVEIINAFKETHIGNITLVKAPSSGYYQALCLTTGIIEKSSTIVANPNNINGIKLPSIKIKEGYEDYVQEIISEKYKYAETYDFGQNLDLWIQYMGNPDRLIPPRDVTISNNDTEPVLMCIKKDGKLLDGDLIEAGESIIYPMFLGEEYTIEGIDITTGDIIGSECIVPQHDLTLFESKLIDNATNQEETIEQICDEILEHSSSQKFSNKMLNYLNVLYKIDGIAREEHKQLRGAYYEYLFFKLLNNLLGKGIIDEVIWNGGIGKYGLPNQAPGGVNGTPDITFAIGDEKFVLELTTIRPKSNQFKAEGSSVPGHISLYKKQTPNHVTGIFCAPQIHERNTAAMKAAITEEDVELKCLTDSDLLEIFKLEDREKILIGLVG